MKKLLAAVFCFVAVSVYAQGNSNKDLNNDRLHRMGTADKEINNHAGGAGGAGNLLYHGGPVMTNAKVVYIFWGWGSADQYASELEAFRTSGMINHISMLGQYSGAGSTGFGTATVFDAVPPPATKVTDAMVQLKVRATCGVSCATDTVYEVFIPAGFYSDDGSGAQSCGGTNLQYCAYHGNGDGVNLPTNIKYSIQPYPSCSGCHGLASWTAYNDQEHFVVHETREAISDPELNAWFDAAGFEADDKCAWGRNLKFLFQESVGGHTFAYQMEYSNSARGCVR
ncbi:MAG TPA: hypothetical protein VGK31_06030 [Thermoanaerobaculia bacterium]|jgi:hypothetical protein